MQILIYGVGYVGLVTGACLSEMGNKVICYDINKDKIARLNRGEMPIYEPGLNELTRRNQKAGRLTFTADDTVALSSCSICFICVPTPSNEDGSADLSYVLDVAKTIANGMNEYKIIINRSTVPVGTANKVTELIERQLFLQRKEIPFDVVSLPEFLKEGSAVSDCMKPDRIVIGSTSPKAIEALKKIYAAFTFNHDRILVMDPLSAELTKYAANAMLATRISFMNELATLCEKTGADIHKIRIGMGSDSRIGYQFLYAGAGFGGSCLPKDVNALIAMQKEVQNDPKILQAVIDVNAQQKKQMAARVKTHFGSLHGKRIAIWGLSFKPDTDDIREAPSLEVIELLQAEGAEIAVYDPVAIENARQLLGEDQIIYSTSEYEAVENADAIILMTEWRQFRFLDLEKVLSCMRGNAFFDGRNQYKPEEMKKLGFAYHGVGVLSERKEHATATS